LARIRDVAVRLQLERSQTTLEVARRKQENDIDEQIAVKSQAVAANEYQRAIEANKQLRNVYPPNEMDRLKLVLDRSELEVRRSAYQREIAKLETSLAQAEVQQNQELLLRHSITAPCAGMVVAVEKRIGEWVEPGTVVVKIVELDRLRIEGFMNAADAHPSRVGSKASVLVEIAGNKHQAEGELVFISPDANPVNGLVRIFIEVDNREQKLRPGLRPTVQLQEKP
jgi:multidrug resistance efflux pump